MRKDFQLPGERYPPGTGWYNFSEEFKHQFEEEAQSRNHLLFWKLMDQAMVMARWQPFAAVNVVMMLTPLAFHVAPEKEDELRPLMVELLLIAKPLHEEAERAREFLLTIHLFELHRLDEARKVLDTFVARSQSKDEISQNMLFLCGLVLSRAGTDIDAHVQVMGAALHSSEPVVDRQEMVVVSAHLYHQSARFQEEEALLKWELETPQSKESPTFVHLSQRLVLVSDLKSAERF